MSYRRRRRITATALAGCVFLTLFWLSPLTGPRRQLVGGHLVTTPPTYAKIIEEERSLPQHNVSLPFPEGKTGRYVKFSNQAVGLGWNNVLNDVLLCSYLAWRANRAYVFQEYTWKPEHYPWRIDKWPWPRTPLSALIAGPTAGGSWELGDDTPRSIRADHWERVCPPEDTEVIGTKIAKEPIWGTDAKYVLEHWLRLLNESPKRCVEIVEDYQNNTYPQTFDLWVVSTTRILTIWPQFRDSPVSRLLKTSPLVQSGVERNERLFFPGGSQDPSDRYGSIMAVHIRRGDYFEACQGFSNYSSTFYQWNLLPELPDPFIIPPRDDENESSPEHEALYSKRCFPTEDTIIAKIQQSKFEWETEADSRGRQELTTLYVMTNAEISWQVAFRARLFAEGWRTVVFSSDLVLNDEQIGVGMAIDMDIGRLAGVFIGNGWSSMTSNIVHRRLVDGHDPSSIRFW